MNLAFVGYEELSRSRRSWDVLELMEKNGNPKPVRGTLKPTVLPKQYLYMQVNLQWGTKVLRDYP